MSQQESSISRYDAHKKRTFMVINDSFLCSNLATVKFLSIFYVICELRRECCWSMDGQLLNMDNLRILALWKVFPESFWTISYFEHAEFLERFYKVPYDV